MSAYDQHFNELLSHFKDIEPNEKKLREKIEVVLCQAYRLKNRSNSSPFVPATRGEWNMLYFNPDLLDKKFELSRDNVYVPTPASPKPSAPTPSSVMTTAGGKRGTASPPVLSKAGNELEEEAAEAKSALDFLDKIKTEVEKESNNYGQLEKVIIETNANLSPTKKQKNINQQSLKLDTNIKNSKELFGKYLEQILEEIKKIPDTSQNKTLLKVKEDLKKYKTHIEELIKEEAEAAAIAKNQQELENLDLKTYEDVLKIEYKINEKYKKINVNVDLLNDKFIQEDNYETIKTEISKLFTDITNLLQNINTKYINILNIINTQTREYEILHNGTKNEFLTKKQEKYKQRQQFNNNTIEDFKQLKEYLIVSIEAAKEERQLDEIKKKVDENISEYRIKISENNKKLNELLEKIEELKELRKLKKSILKQQQTQGENEEIRKELEGSKEFKKKLNDAYDVIDDENKDIYKKIKNLFMENSEYEQKIYGEILDKINQIKNNKYAETLNQIIVKTEQSKIESIDAIKKLDAEIAEYQKEEEEKEG